MEKVGFEDKARQAGSTVKRAATETLASADRATVRAGEVLESAADNVREHLPGSGKAGEMADVISRGVKQTSVYLQEQGISGIVEDVEVLVRRYPLQALLVGLGCGYLLSRFRTD
ncbi:MAG: hypothetical protein K0S45_2790 [Nitrospira sp.]|jgi:hypothetical protein|nr:hypothetical protein [Nitrospira sp.]